MQSTMESVLMFRRALVGAALIAAASLAAMPPVAQTQDAGSFPNRPLRIVTPTAAGGNIDIMARALAEKLATAWGQGVVVEPRPGANGVLAHAAIRNNDYPETLGGSA